MNEKILIKFFLTSVLIFFGASFLISVLTQNASDRRAEAVLRGFQDGYGVMLSQIFKNDALNGNNRAVVSGLEKLVSTSAIDGYIFRSFVSEFERSSFNGNPENYFQSEVDISFSEQKTPAAKITVLTLRSRLDSSKNELIYLNRIGWLVLIAFFSAGFTTIFFIMKRENTIIREYINRFIISNDLGSSHSVSGIWSPILETLRTSKRKVDSLNLELDRARVSEAIARTTQMLAHDVRKPFNLFRMTIDRVKSASSPEQISTILNEALPEVDRSLASVNGLISDVLNVGSDNTIELTPVRLAPVVEEVVEELKKLYPGRILDVSSNLPTNFWIQADLTRLPRVFMNILSNAIEAVESKEVQLWVSAQAVASGSSTGDRTVEVRVGNAGSFIAPEARERIFDLFFTSGKAGGTGLGLAIVKKIISQHGGTVACTSEKSKAFPLGKVEFIFQLEEASPAEESMLQSSSTTQIGKGLPEATPNSLERAQQAIESAHQAPKPNVVFLDDSPLARWVWEAKLKPHTNIRCFAGPREFLEAIESGGVELPGVHTIITDHYFAPDERLTGLDVARELRSQGYAGRILLASNGAFSPAELTGLVDKVVDKNPVEWEMLGI
jgi:signal transduction histidine kinase